MLFDLRFLVVPAGFELAATTFWATANELEICLSNSTFHQI